jgi:D-beta-D-heptose 7-phosphate kinase/D-beta-D-heptose 1-phosphate adenosyltransferase
MNLSLLESISGCRVLVIGDVMLDEYIIGHVRRISPEAPIPVVEAAHREYRPGGASNVAANIAALGGVPLLCGVVGVDEAARTLGHVLGDAGLGVPALIGAADRPTTLKSRIMAHGQQMLRLDSESTAPIPEEVEADVLAWVRASMGQAKACVLSDYAKGVLTPGLCVAIMALAGEHGVPVVVDPKARDFGRYAGATVITPNLREAAVAANHPPDGPHDVDALAADLMTAVGGAALLITRSEAGMSLYQPGVAALHIPTRAQAVHDVTGAGDTVVGALALALAARAPLADAAGMANVAAGIVVGKLGTATVTPAELRAAVGG